GAPFVPEPLRQQLADGGRLVIPVGTRVSQCLTIVDRRGDDFQERKSTSCVFVPLIGRHGWKDTLG
ncbi:MAG: protein-L-isoaspartate O-methyltransferase, partial [Armatimonadota bacterium]